MAEEYISEAARSLENAVKEAKTQDKRIIPRLQNMIESLSLVNEGLKSKWESKNLNRKTKRNVAVYLIGLAAFKKYGYEPFSGIDAGILARDYDVLRNELTLSYGRPDWNRALFQDGILERKKSAQVVNVYDYVFREEGVELLKKKLKTLRPWFGEEVDKVKHTKK